MIKLYNFFSVFTVVFDKQEKISKLLQKFDNFISGIQHGALRTDKKIYSLFFYDFCMVVRIFKIAASLSIFSATGPSLTQQKKQMKSNYKFGQNERQKAHHRFFAATSTPIGTITNLMCSFLLFSFLVVYIIQSRLFEMWIFLLIPVKVFFNF